jgi:hypothetical protein
MLWTTTPLDDDIDNIDNINNIDNHVVDVVTIGKRCFGRQPPWTTTLLDRHINNIGRTATRGYMSRPVFSWMLSCESSHCEAED